MGFVYVIPNLTEMEDFAKLRRESNCRYEFNDFFNPLVLEDTKKQTALIEAYSRVCGSFDEDTLHGAFLDVTIHSSDPLIRQVSEKRVYQSMEIAREMGVRGVVFHTGRLNGFRLPYYLNQWMETNKAFFTRVAEKYPDICIYMENMFDEAPDMMAELARQMKDVDNFRLCLDYAHAIVANANPGQWLEELIPYVGHMHINDNDLVNDLHLPVGDGKTDWQEYDTLMRHYEYSGSVLLEVSGYRAAKKSMEYLRQQRFYPFAERKRIAYETDK